MNKRLQRARNAALRQRFLLGAAMADLNKAVEESKETFASCGIDLDNVPVRLTVLDGGASATSRKPATEEPQT